MLLLAKQLGARVEETRRDLLEKSIRPRLRIAEVSGSLARHITWGLPGGIKTFFDNCATTVERVLPLVGRGNKSARALLSFNISAASQLQGFWSPLPAMGEAEADLKDVSSPKAKQQGANPTHLVVMVNGLFGAPENWNIVIEELEKQIDTSDVLLLASNVLGRTRTFEGIDTCGARVAEEVQDYVKQHPSLTRMSVIGHSMGGLVARYLIGKLYDPESGRISGLKPVHFITLATPHLGCDGEGPAQVPFIGWSSSLPLLGALLQPTLQSMATPVASIMFRRTGQQFFLSDAGPRQLPLLVRMTRDVPGEGNFFSALSSFLTRTAYANSSGDHLVGWANSSLRHPDELPELDPGRRGRGVIRQDPLDAAFGAPAPSLPSPPSPERVGSGSPTSRSRGVGEPSSPTTGGRGGFGRYFEGAGNPKSPKLQTGTLAGRSPSSTLAVRAFSGVSQALETVGFGAAERRGDALIAQEGDSEGFERGDRDPVGVAEPHEGLEGKPSRELAAAEAFVNSSAFHLDMLDRLQSLAWRRIDTCFKGTSMPFFAHNLIQVTRSWLNWEGRETCRHLAEEFAKMERDPRTSGLEK